MAPIPSEPYPSAAPVRIASKAGAHQILTQFRLDGFALIADLATAQKVESAIRGAEKVLAVLFSASNAFSGVCFAGALSASTTGSIC